MRSIYLLIFGLTGAFFIITGLWFNYQYVLTAFNGSEDTSFINLINDAKDRISVIVSGWSAFAKAWDENKFIDGVVAFFKVFGSILFDLVYFLFWFPIRFIYVFIDTIVRLIPIVSRSGDNVINYSDPFANVSALGVKIL